MAAVSRINKIIGRFCRILSLLKGSFAKETYDFTDPTNRRHPIVNLPCGHPHDKIRAPALSVRGTVCAAVCVAACVAECVAVCVAVCVISDTVCLPCGRPQFKWRAPDPKKQLCSEFSKST